MGYLMKQIIHFKPKHVPNFRISNIKQNNFSCYLTENIVMSKSKILVFHKKVNTNWFKIIYFGKYCSKWSMYFSKYDVF